MNIGAMEILYVAILLSQLVSAQDFTGIHEAKSEAQLPMLDLAKFRSEDAAQRQEFIDELRDVLTDVGFFYLTNHGIDEKLTQFVEQEAKSFYDKSMDRKREYISDNDIDLFDGYEELRTTAIYGEINFQEGYCFNMSHFETTVDESPFSHQCYELGMQKWNLLLELLRGYALAANIDENYFVDRHQLQEGKETTSNFRINHYPKIPEGEEIQTRFGPHSDFLTLSVLSQTLPGLEIWNLATKVWEHVLPKPGTVVVNTGDMMQVWTNGRFPSSVHRVRAYASTRNIERVSIILFMGACGDSVIDSRDVFPDEKAKVQPIAAHNYIQARMGAYRRGEAEESLKNTLEFANSDAFEAVEAEAAVKIKVEL